MPDIFDIVFPIFALVALGYGIVATGLLPMAVGQALSKFVFTIPLPLLVFRSLAKSDLGVSAPWSLWMAYFLCVFLVWASAMVVVRFVFGRQGSVLAVAGISAAFSNLVLLGIPVVSGVYGEEGLVPLLLLLSIHLPVMIFASSLMVELYRREEQGSMNFGAVFLRVGKGLAGNPIVVGIVAGVVWGLFNLPIPHLAGLVIDRVAPTTVPLALMAMGMGLWEFGLRGNVVPGLVLACLKVLLFPALFYLATVYLFDLPPLWQAAILVASASPTGVNAYLLANHFNVGHGLAANTTTLSVLLGLVTIPFWITIAAAL